MKKYCQNCGSAVKYSLNSKPKFCPECGKTMFGKAAKAKTQARDLEEITDDEDDISNDIQEWHGTSISSLDIDITPSHDNSFKIGQLFPEEQEKEPE